MKRMLLGGIVALLTGCSDMSPLLNQIDSALSDFNSSLNGGSIASNNLNGADIRISDGPIIRVKQHGATINGETAVEFRCTRSGNTVYLSGFYVIDSGRKSFEYTLAGNADCHGSLLIKLDQTTGRTLTGTAQGYFGNSYYAPLSSDDCLTGKKVMIRMP